MHSKYPCRRKGCAEKQVNGRCRFEDFVPGDENTCSKYRDKKIRKLLSTIAHEAHMMGRIYNKLGEKENPAEVYNKIEKMIDNKVKWRSKAS